jgi:mandelate racemase|tara:strand:+ start:5350 stop:6486 length:1137 start_codon:yes stop_codon:yes gene_type:complete
MQGFLQDNKQGSTLAVTQQLTLESIQVRVVSVPLNRPLIAKIGQLEDWPLILIDIHTKEGIIGRSYLEPYRLRSIPAIVHSIEDIADMFKGKPLAPLDVYGESMRSLHLVGREGITLIALSGIDMAIWDALSKAANMPLATLLGGSPGPVRAYNSNGLWLKPLAELGDEAAALVSEGNYSAIKMRLGRASIKDDVKAIANVREAVGDDVHIMSDFNQGMAFGEALLRLHALDDQGLYWFEEPIVYDNLEACAQITREIKTPIQIGENIYGPREFYKAVVARAADLYMPDLMRIGGVTGWMRAASIAGAAGLPLSSHLYPEVSAHLMRASESADWIESRDWGLPLIAEPFDIKDGNIIVPDRPGNGISWDEAAIKRYAI